MIRRFVDPDTNWFVVRESTKEPGTGKGVVNTTIKNPRTGEVFESSSLAGERRTIAEWVHDIAEEKASARREVAKRRKRLRKLLPDLAAGAKVPSGPLGMIRLRFAEDFLTWGITLPYDDVVSRRRGKIVAAGWAIWYLFGSDETGEYLDYYSSHRMTDDEHVRIHDDGRSEGLPAISGFFLSSDDPREAARLEAKHRAENRRVARMLEAKGFGISGDEPGGVQINRFLSSKKMKE